MNRTVVVTALITGSALVGASYLFTRRTPARALPSNTISLVTPTIDVSVAEDVLEAMERLQGDEVTVVLHTFGGCVTSCVMIANALRGFEKSTAIVPYMALSGGTLIALNAQQLQMGGSASLSAVDPIVAGRRARNMPEDMTDFELHAMAQEYQAAIAGYVRETLAARLPGAGKVAVDRAVSTFMGEHAPHEWPIRRPEVQALGLQVTPATRMWGELVDVYRKRWW